jgi:tRNA-dihydrouridine synthase B
VKIGRLELASPFMQAGLEGHSDVPMRVVARRRGCSYALTEAMSDEMIALGGGHVRRRLAVRDDDRPLAGQLMGVEPGMMARAARVLAGLGYDAIDVNLACPVRKQVRLRGGHLLRHPETAIAMLRAVRDAVPELPVTVKLRRGTDDEPGAADRFHEIFHAAWEAGVDAACVHGRTVEQGYRGTADWSFIAALKRRYPERTILGSGDLFTGADAVRRIDETGVDGVWLARGAIGNPWIFADAAAVWADRTAACAPPSRAAQIQAVHEHFALTLETYDRQRVGPRMRGVFVYYARLHAEAEAVKRAAFALRTVEDVEALLARFY